MFQPPHISVKWTKKLQNPRSSRAARFFPYEKSASESTFQKGILFLQLDPLELTQIYHLPSSPAVFFPLNVELWCYRKGGSGCWKTRFQHWIPWHSPNIIYAKGFGVISLNQVLHPFFLKVRCDVGARCQRERIPFEIGDVKHTCMYLYVYIYIYIYICFLIFVLTSYILYFMKYV